MRNILLAALVLISTKATALEISRYEQLSEQLQNFYIGGIAAGIRSLHTYYVSQSQTENLFFCMPINVAVGGALAKAALATFDGNKKTYVADGVLVGLRDMFPCN